LDVQAVRGVIPIAPSKCGHDACGFLVVILSAFAFMAAAPAFAAEPGNAAAGERLYADYCSNCHGDELRNTSGSVTFDLRRLRPGDRERFDNVVLNGKNQMPPWRGALEPEQIDAIWGYIRSMNDK
jgi:mono/diheme cytochrome c family protein